MDVTMSMVALVLHFLLCERVNSSISSVSKYQDDIDDDLKSFVNAFKMAYLEKRVPRHVTIVGASAEDLSKIQPVFEGCPYIICTKPKTCGYRSSFSQGSFVIIFMDDLKEETCDRHLEILSLCKECKVLYVLRGNEIQTDGISTLFTKTLKNYGVNAQLVYLDKNATKLYGSSVSKNCSIESRLIVDWRPGIATNVDNWAPDSQDLNGCSLTVSTLIFAPKMLIEEQENGSLIITGGLEGELILALAKKFNFTIRPKYPSTANRDKYSRKTSILLEVASGRAVIGIGRLRPTSEMLDKISFSTAYDYDCVSWGVPRVIIRAESVVWIEFSWQVWAWVGLVFAIICITGTASHNINTSTNCNRERTGFAITLYETVAIHVGNPIVHVPHSRSGKFLLVICLLYATVMTTAYKTSLASILTANDESPGIIDTEGIVRANLSVGGASYHLKFLEDQADDNQTISRLIKRFLVINEPSEVMRRLKSDAKFAGVSRRSAMSYERYKDTVGRKPMTFDILEDCVLHHQTAIVFRKASLLREPVDEMIHRLAESGIPNYWDHPKENIWRDSSSEAYFEIGTRDKFKNIFFFYLSCIAVCLLAFLIEMGISIIKKAKKIESTFYG